MSSSVARGLILPVVDWTRANGHACIGLFEGLGVTEEALRGSTYRLSWSDYLELHERLAREVGGVEPLGRLIETVPTPTVNWLLAALDTPARLYRAWSHLAPALWSNLRLQLEDLDQGGLRVRIAVPDEAPVARVWLRASEGFVASLPCRIGFPKAVLEVVQLGDRSAEWIVRAPVAPVGSRPPFRGSLDLVADLGAHYAAAMNELQSFRATRAVPERDLDARLREVTGRWKLTPAQALVLRGVARGLSNKEIAAELGNAEATVEVHVTRLLRKSGASGRTVLVARFWGGAT